MEFKRGDIVGNPLMRSPLFIVVQDYGHVMKFLSIGVTDTGFLYNPPRPTDEGWVKFGEFDGIPSGHHYKGYK